MYLARFLNFAFAFLTFSCYNTPTFFYKNFAIVVDSNDYGHILSRYIHLNWVRGHGKENFSIKKRLAAQKTFLKNFVDSNNPVIQYRIERLKNLGVSWLKNNKNNENNAG